MSNLTSTLTLKLVDDGLAARAKADADAIKKLGASSTDLKKLGSAGKNVGDLTKHLDGLAEQGTRLANFKKGAQHVTALGQASRKARGDLAATAKVLQDLGAGTDEKELRRATRAHETALRKQTRASEQFADALKAQRAARQDALGARGGSIAAAESRIASATRETTAALREQYAVIGRHSAKVAAERGLASGMGGSGRTQLSRIETNRRLIDGMGAPARAQAVEADAHAQTRASRRQDAHEVGKVAVGASLLYAGHKAAERKQEVMHTYREFDDLQRYQGAVADLSEDERKSRIAQALHLGGETRFNDLQVLHAQLDLAQRGVKKDFIEPFVGEVVNYAQAMNTDLGGAAKTLEGILFSTNQNVEDPASALKTMRRQVDLAVKMAKIGGLNDEDVSQAFKFGGASGSGAGLSNETMATTFALLRRSGYSGAEAGVAQRAIASKLVSPTQKGLGALDAMGIRWEDYTTLKRGGQGDLADNAMRRRFGTKLTDNQKAKFTQLFQDEDTFSDEGKFVTAATDIVSGNFGKVAKGKNKGKLSANDAKALAKTFSALRRNMIESVDAEGLLDAILSHDPTLAQANAWGTDKHGGKILALARKYKEFKEYQEQLRHTPEGFAKGIGEKRNAGYAGAAARLEGSQKNLDSSIGQSLDNGGAGNGGFLTDITSASASAVQSLAELPKPLLAVGASAAYLGGKLASLTGGALLAGATGGVVNAVAAGNGAAVAAGAGAAVAVAAPVIATIAVGAALAAADKSKGIVHGGKNVDTRLDASDELPGLSGMDAEVKRPDVRAIPSMLGGGAQRGAMPGVGTAGASFGLGGAQASASSAVPAGPIFDTAKVDGFTAKLGEAEAKAQQLGATQATPQIGTGPVDNLIARVTQAINLVAQLGAAVANADAGIARVNAGAGQLQGRTSDRFHDGVTPGRGSP